MKSFWVFEDINLFSILCPHKFKEYQKTHTFKNYIKNEYVYFEDETSDKVYLIHSGKVKIGYYTESGEEIVIAILSKGEIFGEKAIFGEDKRNEFALSIDNKTFICPITSNVMMSLIKDNTEFSLRIYKFIGIRFKKLERRLQVLLYKDTKTRLKEFLKELKDEYGTTVSENDKKTRIEHPYTQKDIATLIGTSRPTLNILLNELQDEGYLTFERNKIILQNNN